MSDIVLSTEAKRDIQGIRDYITEEQGNAQTALDVMRKILGRIESLSDFPDSGALLSPKVNFRTNYRYISVAGYLVFYRHENNRVFVDRVLHGKRDYITNLFPLE